jgi:hypothetical protein
MQMAMKIVEMRIMSRATPSSPNCLHPGKHGSFRHGPVCAPQAQQL